MSLGPLDDDWAGHPPRDYIKRGISSDDHFLDALNASCGEPIARPNGAGKPPVRAIKGAGDFIDEYQPIVYAIDGILPSGCIYGVTAKRGAGKTALLQGTALSVITNRANIMGYDDVEQGRVAYIILENPADFRMKLAVNAYVHNIDKSTLNDNLAILDAKLPHAEMMMQLRDNAEEQGPFRLVCYDTLQAGFSGAQFNDNKDALNHAQALRELTTLPGGPGVLVACHPIKNATKDNLEPFGGGATMNEFDGNLWLWNDEGRIELGWNKVRGPEPGDRFFRIEKLGAPHILDSKGRTPLLPVMRPMSVTSIEQSEKTDADLDRALLQAMADNPDGTQTEWGAAIGRSKGRLNKRLQKLEKLKLVEGRLGKWYLTPKGMKEVS
jgi:AAA domain